MNESDPIVGCSACGRRLPRSEMFGVEPDLNCPACAAGVRKRMHVRYRPLPRDRGAAVTKGVVAVAAVLYLLDHFVYPNPRLAVGVWPPWFEAFWLALHPGPRIWDGYVWQLLGAAFFHGNFIHILFNCWWIWELGRATEAGFGRLTMLLVLVGGAMVATGVEWMVNGPGVGLSGVVYALAFFLWAHHRTNPYAAAIMSRRTINFLSIWFVLCIVLTMTGTWNIANWAHGAGGLWGWGVGLALAHRQRRLLLPLAAVATVLIIASTPVIAVGHQARLKQIDAANKARGVSGLQRNIRYYNAAYDLRRK